MAEKTTDSEMIVKRGQFMLALVAAIASAVLNFAGGAYLAGRLIEKMDHFGAALAKLDVIPARVLVLEQSDREFDRRLNEVERRLRDTEQRRKAD